VDARRWAAAMAPLADAVAGRFLRWLPKATYPVRYGVHSNSAFGLSRALPYARAREEAGDPELASAITAAAGRWYGNDTGYFPEETWAYLEKSNTKFDFVSLDCTGMAWDDWRSGHMCLPVNAEVRDRLLALGRANEKTIFCCHHFSHNGGLTHDAFVPLAAREGFLVSYDGMEVTF